MTTRGAFFMNPSSGSPSSGQSVADIRAAVEEKGLAFYEINRELDIPGTIRERLARGDRLFVAAGGDGTVNHVLQALVYSDGILAVLPVGTLNHFAKDLGLPLEWRKALDVAIDGDIRTVDVGRVNERYFANNISLGLYPRMLEKKEHYKHLGKWKAYRLAVWWAIRRYPSVGLSFETPDQMHAARTHVFMVSVNEYDLGKIGTAVPRKSLDGGTLAVYWMPHVSKLKFIRAIARFLRGALSIADGLRSLRTRLVKIQPAHREVKVGMDGELFTMTAPLSVSIVPQALRVKVPTLRELKIKIEN